MVDLSKGTRSYQDKRRNRKQEVYKIKNFYKKR